VRFVLAMQRVANPLGAQAKGLCSYALSSRAQARDFRIKWSSRKKFVWRNLG